MSNLQRTEQHVSARKKFIVRKGARPVDYKAIAKQVEAKFPLLMAELAK